MMSFLGSLGSLMNGAGFSQLITTVHGERKKLHSFWKGYLQGIASSPFGTCSFDEPTY